MNATICPQYDANGIDSGLWIMYAGDFTIIENLDIRISRPTGKLIVGQFPDWDNETYDECGYIDAEYKKLGELDCPNPFMDDEAATKLYEWLKDKDVTTV